MSVFFSLSFKKCNKLDEYIYTYFFIIAITPLNNFFYNIYLKYVPTIMNWNFDLTTSLGIWMKKKREFIGKKQFLEWVLRSKS